MRRVFGDSHESARMPAWMADDGSQRYGRFIVRVVLVLAVIYGLPTAGLTSADPVAALVPTLLIPVPLGVAALTRRLHIGSLLLLSVPLLIPWLILASAASSF